MDNFCVCCGAPIGAEDRWICHACEMDPLRLANRTVRLRDLLAEAPPCHITYRYDTPEGELCGHCNWTGTKLISLDGDGYNLSDVVERYKWEQYQLTVWLDNILRHS